MTNYTTCPKCGAEIPVAGASTGKSGRKPLAIPVIFICDKLRLYRDVDAVAKELGCSRGYIYNQLKAAGLTLKEVLESSEKTSDS